MRHAELAPTWPITLRLGRDRRVFGTIVPSGPRAPARRDGHLVAGPDRGPRRGQARSVFRMRLDDLAGPPPGGALARGNDGSKCTTGRRPTVPSRAQITPFGCSENMHAQEGRPRRQQRGACRWWRSRPEEAGHVMENARSAGRSAPWGPIVRRRSFPSRALW